LIEDVRRTDNRWPSASSSSARCRGNPETATAPTTLLQNWNPDAKKSRITKLDRDVALKVLPDSFASDRNAAKVQANLFIERLRWKSTPSVPT
jgi:hypothetical protein